MNNTDVLNIFHPVVKEWFLKNIGTPSLTQTESWPKIKSGKSVLISAPTGTGKTLAAFLESINKLLEMGIRSELPDGVFILYVSPLKALNNDIYKNLEMPLNGIKLLFEEKGGVFPDIRKAVRTGDTTPYERTRILKKPPHILITTPESLFLMLTSPKSRDILKNVRYLIVDEIHTMLATKRGVHLALSMERLEVLAEHGLTRIGLSATVNPVETAAKFLGGLSRTGNGFVERPVEIIVPAIKREKEIKIHVPVNDFRVLDQGTVWPDIYDELVKIIPRHKSTLVFVNNRATAERVAANVNSIAGSELCQPHHGSISKSSRLAVENSFKTGELRCIVATSTLELGIDVGSVDCIVQISAPPSISSGLQRLGRSGHRLSATSKGIIILKSRGDLLKAYFIAREMLDENIEKEQAPVNCLDVLAQHIVSMGCNQKWHEDDMFNLVKQAYSYRTLKESEFKKVLAMLSGDFEHRDDIPVKPRIYWDRQNRTIEGTSYSRMLAVSSGGTIPDRGAFSVYLEDYKTRIGELDEEFVFETRIGDRFILGNSSWRVVWIDKNRVIVSPSSTEGSKTPFWKGDGIGSPFEQAVKFGRFIQNLADKINENTFMENINQSLLLDERAALNIRNYILDQAEALGTISSDRRIIVEYTSSSETDNKIIIHAHFGGRVNSVLALLFQYALDKHAHCKAYTSYTDDAVLIHFYGFFDEITNIFSLISSKNAEQIMINALPLTSRFALTFRYNAYRALMMGVRKYGQRIPLWIQRLRSVDTFENAQKYLDHPLIIETMRECLEYAFDIPNAISLLNDIERGKIEVIEKKTWFPSPFASEILFQFQQEFLYLEKAPYPGNNEYPAISGPEALNLSYKSPASDTLLRSDAILRIIQNNNARYKLEKVNSPNELHSFLLIYGDTEESFLAGIFKEWAEELMQKGRIVLLPSGRPRYIATEEITLYETAENTAIKPPDLEYISRDDGSWTQDEAITRILRRYARYNSPFSMTDLTDRYPFPHDKLEKILAKLRAEGYLIYSREQGCYYHSTIYDRGIRLSLNMAADEIKTRDTCALSQFIANWQKIGHEPGALQDRLFEAVVQLEGLYLPADAWESIVFPARIKGYNKNMLDKLCSSGLITWHIMPGESISDIKLAWYRFESISESEDTGFQTPALTGNEEVIYNILLRKGACFTHALTSISGIPASELMDILRKLTMMGLVINDSFQPIRYFLNQKAYENMDPMQKARRIALMVSKPEMGRWEIAKAPNKLPVKDYIKRCVLRYGIVSKEVFSLGESPYTWPEAYEALKSMEYAGEIQRGYFFSGISGIQFMTSEAVKMSHMASGDFTVLNACDPAQPYGRIIPHSEHSLRFSCLPANAIVLYHGEPVLLLERYGEKITYSKDHDMLFDSIAAFKKAFTEKRIWPDRKKIVVKIWPEDEEKKSILKSALAQSGFMPEIDRMVLWASG